MKRQLYIVLGSALVLAVILIGSIALLSGHEHRMIMLGSLRRALERIYDRVATETSHEAGKPVALSTSELRAGLLDAWARQLLPSFVNSTNVFVPLESVPFPSECLICAVRLEGDGTYGITARRLWREIGAREFSAWPHESLSSNAAETRKTETDKPINK